MTRADFQRRTVFVDAVPGSRIAPYAADRRLVNVAVE
jgi:hypothetical protein